MEPKNPAGNEVMKADMPQNPFNVKLQLLASINNLTANPKVHLM